MSQTNATAHAMAQTVVRSTAALLLASSIGLGLSCGGSEPEPETPATTASVTGPATATQTATAATTEPSATTAAPTQTASPIAAVEPALAQAAQAVLAQVAKEEAPPGAQPMGVPKVSLLGTGQASEEALTLEPGKCYTVIAVGLPPVAELNVQLLPAAVVPGVQPVLAQDQDVGARAVVGRAPNCFKWPLPVAGGARVVTTVASGTGLVATQVFVK